MLKLIFYFAKILCFRGTPSLNCYAIILKLLQIVGNIILYSSKNFRSTAQKLRSAGIFKFHSFLLKSLMCEPLKRVFSQLVRLLLFAHFIKSLLCSRNQGSHKSQEQLSDLKERCAQLWKTWIKCICQFNSISNIHCE